MRDTGISDGPERRPTDAAAGELLVPTPVERTRHAPTPKALKRAGRARQGNTSDQSRTSDVVGVGVVGDASEASAQSRSGEDTRQRGWFWHWNSLVTQYAPLIGLKGVGLLNSYTVWTDRREKSPHRGYAFPSQQSEADFYGEDRAELITINKILVALDLIEIRKEMVLRTDERGRRWKVPHNFYRVKDHGDDFSLTTRDVLRVAALADKDRAVYRYLRRVFSPRFSPIDGDNVWHQILDEARPTDVWQRLAARTERDETRASARTKAGHASRRANDDKDTFLLPDRGDNATSEATVSDSPNDSSTGDTNDGAPDALTSVAGTNTGLATNDAQGNNGWVYVHPTIVAGANRDWATSVDPSNTTYNQEQTTTTMDHFEIETTGESATDTVRTHHEFADPPDSQRAEDRAIQLFEEANDRRSTPAERRLLRKLAGEFDETVGSDSDTEKAEGAGEIGWERVAAAIDEAVAAGSAFVAPKRIREILLRWARDGAPDTVAKDAPRIDGLAPSVDKAVTRAGVSSHRLVPAGRSRGNRNDRVWRDVERALRGVMTSGRLEELFRGTVLVTCNEREAIVSVVTERQREDFSTTLHDLVCRKLADVLRRPVRLSVVGPDDTGEDDGGARAGYPERSGGDRSRGAGGARANAGLSAGGLTAEDSAQVPTFTLAACHMTNRQVWSAVLSELRASAEIGRVDVDTWLRDAQVVECDPDGTLIVGVPHVLAQRRAAGRHLAAIRSAVRRVTGVDFEVRVVLIRDWWQDHERLSGTST